MDGRVLDNYIMKQRQLIPFLLHTVIEGLTGLLLVIAPELVRSVPAMQAAATVPFLVRMYGFAIITTCVWSGLIYVSNQLVQRSIYWVFTGFHWGISLSLLTAGLDLRVVGFHTLLGLLFLVYARFRK